MKELQGRVALITGGARGLGEAMARRFAEEGAHVVIADLLDEGRNVASEIGGSFHRLDVTDEDGWAGLVKGIGSTHGRFDILVNNAAIFHHNIPFLELGIDKWREQMRVNADSAFLGCKHGILAMKQLGSRGSIINMSSLAALSRNPNSVGYAASKSAILTVTRTAAVVGGPFGIRVNAILPGLVMTDMSRGSIQEGSSEEEFVAKVLPMYPLGRIGEKQDFAEAALFLASDRSSFISGDLLRVDGAQAP